MRYLSSILSTSWPITRQPPLIVVGHVRALQWRTARASAGSVLGYLYCCHNYTNCVVGAVTPGALGTVKDTSGISGTSGSPAPPPPPKILLIPAQIPPKTPAAPARPETLDATLLTTQMDAIASSPS